MATIEKRVRNGRTTYRMRYRDPAGRQRSRSFARKVDAQRWLHENETARAHGAYIDPAAGKTPLGELAERWYATTAAHRPSSRASYRQYLDNHVLPAFGPVPLASLDPLAVREWYAAMAGRGLAPATCRKALAVLGQVLTAGVEAGLLHRNVARGLKLPKATRREQHVLTAVEVERLADAIRPPYATLIRFAAWTGLRPSEYVALRVKHLDLLAGTVRVATAAVEVGGRLAWGPPKTGEARTVRLPRFLCDELGRYLADRPHDRDALVFCAPKGAPLRMHHYRRLIFHPAARAAGLPEGLRPYDLRHTCASLLIREGASIKAVQAQLGHKTASITLDVYGHLFPDELESLSERMDRARAAAVAVWPQRGPAVVPLDRTAGQRGDS